MKYFKLDEFKCKCGCGQDAMDPAFLEILDDARDMAGVPFEITSGFRCVEHNRNERAKATSSHPKGYAADIRAANSGQRIAIIRGLLWANLSRIGVGDGFVHVDMDPDKAADVMWTYY